MSEALFMPGPCSVEVADEIHINIVHDHSGLRLAMMVGTDFQTGGEFDLKYAQLFAAAPDMSIAIKAALCDDPDWRRLCVDALALAEGRTT